MTQKDPKNLAIKVMIIKDGHKLEINKSLFVWPKPGQTPRMLPQMSVASSSVTHAAKKPSVFPQRSMDSTATDLDEIISTEKNVLK